eukprot:s3515_g4.t1
MSGVRMVMGDFNQEPGDLTQQRIWMRHGWRSAQHVAAELFQHEVVPTCKGSPERDQIWLSPEAIQLLRGFWVEDVFTDHSTLALQLAVPTKQIIVNKWPRPAALPWSDLDLQDWHPDCSVQFASGQDPTEFMKQWAHAFESSVFDHAQQADQHLPQRCRGRAQRLRPVRQELATPTCKSSREGEVQAHNSMMGTAPRLWFRQLRRLQSLKHAVCAGNQSHSACVYRVELWEAIKRSSGFVPDFANWWSAQQHKVHGVPQVLPLNVPDESAIAIALYDSFLLHFRAFEQFHLQERTNSLKLKYAGSLEAVYMDLRKDPRPSVDHLWHELHYTILDVDVPSQQIHLDKAVQSEFDSVWLHDQHSLSVTSVSGDICRVGSTEHLAPGDELVQRVFLTDTNDVLHAFSEFWKPRWSSLATVPDADWQRIAQFAQVHMAKHAFVWEPITLAQWRRTVKTFKPRAARGTDGFAKEDLVSMPDSYVDAFLGLLNSIETTATPWPAQLTNANVLGLAKHDGAHTESQFRPITLFSTLYRAWARLRTRQFIRQMAQWIPSEALGFLPGRETTEVWLQLQAQIELMLQGGHDYTGLSTDLKKAFNHIGRAQVFLIAERVGLPWQLCNAWKKFLETFTRRFDVHGCLGSELRSSSGFPEGCPLSIVSMLMVNWSYHVYMKIFCPRVCSYSFVDNLTLAAQQVEALVRAFFALQTICGLFGLSTDAEKTYVWALTKSSRDQLHTLGFPCLSDASELGGAMTFGLSKRTRILRLRGSTLQPRWLKLKRSLAPGAQKLSVLSKVFWPQALHGSAGCPVADNYAHELRREAVKALRLNGAGSNPFLRLSLADDMRADPGFFQIQLCLATFRRMLLKCSDLLQMWRTWMANYDGHLLPGPFSRLLSCLSTLGWAVTEPPLICDHEGHCWNLMTMDGKTLSFLLEDAWLQFVAAQAKHRTMCDLAGIDGFLTKLDCRSMSALDRARVSALHSGAFMTSLEHSKYDSTKSPLCPLCNCPDDREHWLRCPRFQHLRNAIPHWCADNLELPVCTLNHLLVPRQKCLVTWRKLLCETTQGDPVFHVLPPKTGYHHLFVDGSCTNDEFPMLNLAAWGIVNATLGTAVASGPLPGIAQTIDRAELMSVLVGLRWASGTELGLCLWSDSLSTVNTLDYLLQYDLIPDGAANLDLWLEVLSLLQDRAGLATDVRWVPSHLAPDATEDAFEDWVVKWNDSVDRLAVAEQPDQQQAQPDDVVSVHSSDDELLWLSWEDHLPLSWRSQCLAHAHQVPGVFLVSIVEWICAAERIGGKVRDVSDLEFVFALLLDKEFSFPFSVDGTLDLHMRTPDSMFQRPTLVMMLRSVQTALKSIHRLFSFVIRTPSLSNPALGVYMKFNGTRFCVPEQLWSRLRSHVQLFTAKRAVLPVLEKEYVFWMNSTLGHFLPSLQLNVYFSNAQSPRPESYFEDLATAKAAKRPKAEVYRSIRSGAESGWDFSSRWLGDGENLSTIQAEKVVPVDLNCVLLRMERLLSRHLQRRGSRAAAARYAAAAAQRTKAMQRLLWSEKLKSFRDFRLDTLKHSEIKSISDFAAPLWAGLPEADQGIHLLKQLEHSGLLQMGGASTTTRKSGQQWDAPNAWAPLQLMLIEGLEDLAGALPGAMALAEDLSQKWLRNCFEAWQKHKAMFEKYDAFRVGEGGGGGEYTPQTGFGWSNGVAMVLLAKNGNRSSPFVPPQRIILATWKSTPGLSTCTTSRCFSAQPRVRLFHSVVAVDDPIIELSQ